MYPNRTEAERLLREAEGCNPGPWGDHSRVTAHCAECIARRCGLDAEKAYVLGLLHDIGRRFGTRHLGHVSDGYRYMLSLGWDEAARVCLSHSFTTGSLEDFVGRFDVTDGEFALIREGLEALVPDDYDRLIRLCDSLAGSEGVLDIEERMRDVERRYGSYPRRKWEVNLALKRYFEEKAGEDLYIVVDKEHFRP